MTTPTQTAMPRAEGPRTWAYVWGAVSVVAVIAVVLVLVRSRQSKPPTPTDDPVAVTKYVATPAFLKLGFDEQRAYLLNLRKATAALRTARETGHLDDAQYRLGRAGGWIGGKLEHLHDYLKQPNDKAKREYIDTMLAHRKEKKAASADDDVALVNSPEVKRIVRSWSKRRETDWEEFHKVTHERKAKLATSAPAAAGHK